MTSDDHAADGPATGQIIPASQELKERCARPGNASLAALDAIANAEAALAELSVNFKDWMVAEVERLSDARAGYRDDATAPDRQDALFQAAHDLKGQGGTLGYPIAAQVCASLCRLLECFGKDGAPLDLVDHHVDAVKAMLREEASGEENGTALALSRRLRAVTDDLIASRERRGDSAA